MRHHSVGDGLRHRTSPCDLHRLEGHVVDGRYRVLKTAVAGPRAVVYEVEPPGVGTTRRALKVFTLPEARDPEAVERLATHVEVVRTLDNPDLERAYSHGCLIDETPYLVTEWLPYAALSRAIQGGVRLPAGVALPLIIRVAQAVGALHERGLCHGDVRAEHVLWSGADLETVKLIDGGVTPAFRPPPVSAAASYLAPERFLGQPPGPAADVYALAVLAWRLRTGRFPFESQDPRADEVGMDPVARLQWLHHHAGLPNPEEVAPDAEWPGAVDAVLVQALSKSPGARFVHAGVFASALSEAIHCPTPAPTDSVSDLEAAHDAAQLAFDDISIDAALGLEPLDETPGLSEDRAPVEHLWAGTPVTAPPVEEVREAAPTPPEAALDAPLHTPQWGQASWPLLAVGVALGGLIAWML